MKMCYFLMIIDLINNHMNMIYGFNIYHNLNNEM